jgi:hypothetical protein
MFAANAKQFLVATMRSGEGIDQQLPLSAKRSTELAIGWTPQGLASTRRFALRRWQQNSERLVGHSLI